MTALFSAWLPLSTAVLVSVIEHLPSPPNAQASRLPEMIKDSPGANLIDRNISEAIINFKTGENDPIVGYVSKMVAIPESELPSLHNRRSGGTLTADEAREMARKKREEIARLQAEAGVDQLDELSRITSNLEAATLEEESRPTSSVEKADREHLIGFARLYSGILSVGDSIYALSPKFTPANPNAKPAPQKVTITNLYLLMGRSLEPLKSVPAGVVFGVEGLAGHILKTGTLSSQRDGAINLAGLTMASPPIVRVALEPVNPADLNRMIAGLRMLEQSDPCAQYEVLPSGEHVIATAGELHFERCLKDLRERFARCEIQAGEPIVPYRESIISALEMAAPKNPELGRGGVLSVSPSKQLTIKLRVVPLPQEVTDFLTKNIGTLKRLHSERRANVEPHEGAEEAQESNGSQGVETSESLERNVKSSDEFRKELLELFRHAQSEKDLWPDVVDRIMAFGPRRVGPNILVDSTLGNLSEKL
jgi:ribosome assembly protein 1